MSAPLALCALTLLAPAAGPPAHPWSFEVGLTAEQVGSRAAALREAGYRPTCVSGYNVGEAVRFAVVWEKAGGPAWMMDYGLTPARLDRRAVDLKAAGYRPVGLSGYDLVGTQGFIDLWRKESGPAWQVNYGMDGDGLRRLAGQMKARGYRPRTLSSYMSGTISRYALVWEKGAEVPWELRWGLSPDGFGNALDNLAAEGYRPVAIGGLGIFEQVTYSAVWEKRKGPDWLARYNLDADGLSDLARAMRGRGYKPVYLAGYGTFNGPRFASIWEKVGP
jgi:hypothetical protein